METLSRRYHQLDGNSDGRVSRKEFETFFKSRDDAADKERSQADNFFKQLVGIFVKLIQRNFHYFSQLVQHFLTKKNFLFLKQTVTVGPIVERERIGNETRMRYFSAGARKFAAIAHVIIILTILFFVLRAK